MSLSCSCKKNNENHVDLIFINDDHEITTQKKYKYKIINSIILPVHMIWELIIKINHVFISEKEKKQKNIKIYFLDNVNDDYDSLVIISEGFLNQ